MTGYRRTGYLVAATFLMTALLTACQTHPPVWRAPTPERKYFPGVQNFYPMDMQFMNVQGTAIVNVCIDPSGRLSKPPSISKSSGSPELDRSALAYATATSGDWTPGTRDGVPINYCARLPIIFKLHPLPLKSKEGVEYPPWVRAVQRTAKMLHADCGLPMRIWSGSQTTQEIGDAIRVLERCRDHDPDVDKIVNYVIPALKLRLAEMVAVRRDASPTVQSHKP